MIYKGFDIKITPEKVLRTISGGQAVECDGFIIEIYGENKSVPFEIFNVAVGLREMLQRENAPTYFTRFCAAAVVVSIVPTGLFFLLQRYYVEGVTGGSVKG